MRSKVNKNLVRGFTLIEVMMVIGIIIAASSLVIPLAMDAVGMQVPMAAERMISDFRFAQEAAITRNRSFIIVFDLENEGYQITDDSGTVVKRPGSSRDYAVYFREMNWFKDVDIVSVKINSMLDEKIQFDSMGMLLCSSGEAVTEAVITLKSGKRTVSVSIDPDSGQARVDS